MIVQHGSKTNNPKCRNSFNVHGLTGSLSDALGYAFTMLYKLQADRRVLKQKRPYRVYSQRLKTVHAVYLNHGWMIQNSEWSFIGPSQKFMDIAIARLLQQDGNHNLESALSAIPIAYVQAAVSTRRRRTSA